MKVTKKIRSRVFKLAHKLVKDAKANFITKSFAEALSLAWKVLKEWSGNLNERIEIAYQIDNFNGAGFNRPINKTLTVVIR